MTRTALLLASVLFSLGAKAAEPVKIGITTILSSPIADRGQSEQYGAQRALDEINQAGGVLGRPVEAFYADNACKPDIGVPATRRLLEVEHVPVVIGALCTPVTHAIMPMMAEARVPLVIATSAGQDFVDASGPGGNDYAFKTIPSETDIARGLLKYLAAQKVSSVAVVTDAIPFLSSSAVAMARLAPEFGIRVTRQETIPDGTKEFGPLLQSLTGDTPDRIVAVLGGSAVGFFRAYEASGAKPPVTGRFDIRGALGAVSPAFRDAGGLARLTSVSVFTPLQDTPGVQAFVRSYTAHTGLVPTQRSFFVYEAVYLVVDAIRRAGSDQPAAIEAALKTTTMPSLLGGSYALDDHNHPHIPVQILGVRDGKAAVIATE